jgi:transcriptional regulator of NAD metabolism
VTALERRRAIVNLLTADGKPITGTDLAEQFGVSRQIIVQDISWLRAAGHQILSTTKGYLLQSSPSCSCVLKVQHTDEQIEDELNTIVDLGGTVVDVSVYHDVYGYLKAPLYVASRHQVQEFLDSLKKRKANPLKNLTANIHCHTIEAETNAILQMIEQALKSKGYLIQRV